MVSFVFFYFLFFLVVHFVFSFLSFLLVSRVLFFFLLVRSAPILFFFSFLPFGFSCVVLFSVLVLFLSLVLHSSPACQKARQKRKNGPLVVPEDVPEELVVPVPKELAKELPM